MAITDPQLANENTRLLAWIWSHAFTLRGRWWWCACGAHAVHRLDVVHAPGCILWGRKREALAALDGFEIASGEVL